MNWRIYSIISVSFLFLRSCSTDKTKLDDLVEHVRTELEEAKFNNKVDPTVFACIYDRSMTDFDVVTSNNETEMLILSEKLGNGRNLSLFFLGTGNTIAAKDYRFNNSKEWHIKSGTNICYITYAFDNQKATVYNLYFYVRKILKMNRAEHVAREAVNLVLNVRKKCLATKTKGCLMHGSQTNVLGYSLGAHIGAYACRYLFEETGDRVKTLIGLDPAAISHWINTDNYIKRGDAEYVQVIHTSYLGTQMQRGDSDIYIKSDNWNPHSNHILALEVNELVCAKKAIFIAAENGNGRVINLQENLHVNPKLLKIAYDECLVGVYNDVDHKRKHDGDDDQHGKVYKIKLPNKSFNFY